MGGWVACPPLDLGAGGKTEAGNSSRVLQVQLGALFIVYHVIEGTYAPLQP